MNWAAQFESIGDNCEFGFIQRLAGFDEGSLLKWCYIEDHRHLVKFLESPFCDFYKFDNLVPKHDDMVVDLSSGLIFHTELYSHADKNGARTFNEDVERQQQIYMHEHDKRTHLYSKLMRRIVTGSKVLIFKQNGVNNLTIAHDISSALLRHGSKFKIFYVTDCEPSQAGRVEMIDNHIYRGFIERFAPYWPVTDTKVEYWQSLCERMLELSKHDTSALE